MTPPNFPSENPAYRRADIAVHAFGLLLIVAAGALLLVRSSELSEPALFAAVVVYILCALASNLASWAYHFAPWPEHRILLRRIDHAAIYPSISGTFTPFFVLANTNWTISLLFICWALTGAAVWNKITNETIKSKWSTASYIGLGAIGLCAMPDLTGVPIETLWFIIAGSASYVFGTAFYARKTLPYRYAIWHMWVNIGAIMMFFGVWSALFSSTA